MFFFSENKYIESDPICVLFHVRTDLEKSCVLWHEEDQVNGACVPPASSPRPAAQRDVSSQQGCSSPLQKGQEKSSLPTAAAGSSTLLTGPSLYLQQGFSTSYHYLLIALLYARNFPLIYCICKSNQVQHMSFLSLR